VTDAHDAAVLDAVARILGRRGVAGLSMTAIAEEAGLSRVTLHRRGTSIDDYVVAVLGRASDDLRASLWDTMTDTAPAATRLVAALGILCDVCERHRGVMMAMYGKPARPLPGRPGRTTSLEFIDPFERILRDGDLDGSLTTSDPRRDATLIANTVAWTYLHMRFAHGWERDVAREHTVLTATAHATATPHPDPIA
jgi:AcrR family transcriptional regulator